MKQGFADLIEFFKTPPINFKILKIRLPCKNNRNTNQW